MDRPRVLTVVRPTEGGIRAHLKNLLENLSGEFSFVLACPPDEADWFAHSGWEVIPVSLTGTLYPAGDLQTMRELFTAMRSGRFSLVHAHGFKAGFVARPVSRLCGVPCLMTVHGGFAHAEASRWGRIYKTAERFLSRWGTGYIAVSGWLAEELSRAYHVPGEQITVIPNGIVFPPLTGKWRAAAKGEFLVGTVARLAPQKGVEYFLRAAAILKERFGHIRFIVAGEGPLRSSLELLCRQLSLDGRVSFTGYCHDVPSLLQRLDVFVLPSLSEGQGITILEAMAAGCPVVASATGGITELVQHGKTGLLAAPGNPDELAVRIAELLKNPALADELAKRGKENAAHYDLSVMIDRTRKLYNSVMEGGRPV
ncbi:MAG: glycosyltransferase family 4 protein [Bacillota bacterium]|nr:glycosyltransferase family 4 protein [Bacillota bacterium]MDW7682751.1 glycosyltransferase family 4 protein [Bacillota bacterium]